jgi:hypothetical protein
MQLSGGAEPALKPGSHCVPSPEVQGPHRQRLAERVYHEHGAALRRLANGWIRRYGIGDRVAPDVAFGPIANEKRRISAHGGPSKRV